VVAVLAVFTTGTRASGCGSVGTAATLSVGGPPSPDLAAPSVVSPVAGTISGRSNRSVGLGRREGATIAGMASVGRSEPAPFEGPLPEDVTGPV
jgi:hypothetical protein